MNTNFDFDLDEEPTAPEPDPHKPTLPSTFNYPPSMPHDLACCMSDEEVEALRERYAYSPTEFSFVLDRMDFKQEFSQWRQKLVSEGSSFKLKLRAMAEEYLPQVHYMLNSEQVTPAVKSDLWKYVVRCGELEPPKEKAGEGGGGNGPKITIEIKSFGGSTPQTVNINGE